MDIQEWVDALDAECRIGEEIRKTETDVWTRGLFPGEAEILAAVSDGRLISLSPSDLEFPIIHVGQQPIVDTGAPFVLSQYWYALTSLANRGVLSRTTDDSFRVEEVARIRGCRERLISLFDGE